MEWQKQLYKALREVTDQVPNDIHHILWNMHCLIALDKSHWGYLLLHLRHSLLRSKISSASKDYGCPEVHFLRWTTEFL